MQQCCVKLVIVHQKVIGNTGIVGKSEYDNKNRKRQMKTNHNCCTACDRLHDKSMKHKHKMSTAVNEGTMLPYLIGSKTHSAQMRTYMISNRAPKEFRCNKKKFNNSCYELCSGNYGYSNEKPVCRYKSIITSKYTVHQYFSTSARHTNR